MEKHKATRGEDSAAEVVSASAETKKEAAEDVVVTMEHSSFGAHTVRVPVANVASFTLNEAIHSAEKHSAARSKISSIDAEQMAIALQIEESNRKVEAARVLGDTAAESRHKREAEQLQDRVNALSVERAKVYESF